jgi:hypothetical protein
MSYTVAVIFTSLHFTSLHYTTLHSISRHSTSLHFILFYYSLLMISTPIRLVLIYSFPNLFLKVVRHCAKHLFTQDLCRPKLVSVATQWTETEADRFWRGRIGWYGLDWSGSGYRQVEISVKKAMNLSVFIKCWLVIEWLHNWRPIQKGSSGNLPTNPME